MYTQKGRKLLRKVTAMEQAVARGTIKMEEVQALKKELEVIRSQFTKDLKEALGPDRQANANKFSTVTVAEMDDALYNQTMKKVTTGLEKLSANI